MNDSNPFVVSSEWLVKHLRDPGLSIVDGSWYLAAQNRDARAEYDAAHIPGAIFFDQDDVVDPDGDLPHALPSPQVFARHASAMGITRDDTIVVYDGPGFFSAPRVWWLFRVMGAEKVYILDGGIDRWKAESHIVTSEPTVCIPSSFIPRFDRESVVALAEMRDVVDRGSGQVADARPPGRFAGTDPEPRAGVRSGHMPGARNVPALDLSKDGSLLPADKLKRKFEQAGIDLSRPVVTSCGSGVTAAMITLALHSIGHTDNRLYDGSWSEWGGRDDTPVET